MSYLFSVVLFSVPSAHAETVPTPTPLKVRAGRLTESCAADDLSCQNQILLTQIRNKNSEGMPQQVELFSDGNCQQNIIVLRLTGNNESDAKICGQMMLQMNPAQKIKSLRRVNHASERGPCKMVEEESFTTLCERL